MTSEELRLLKEFDVPQLVEAACRLSFGQSRHFAVPAMVKSAVKSGLLAEQDGDGQIVDSDKIYGRLLMLTDIGREACKLPKATTDRPVVKSKAAQKGFDFE